MRITQNGKLIFEVLMYGKFHEYRYRIGFASVIDSDCYYGIHISNKEDLEFSDINRVMGIKIPNNENNKTKYPLYHRDIVTSMLISVEALGEADTYFNELFSLEGLCLLEPLENNILQVIHLDNKNYFELESVINGLKDRQHPFHKMDVNDFVSFLEL